MGEKIYISFYLQALIIISVYMIVTGKYTGELDDFVIDISLFELIFLSFYSFLSFVLGYYFYKKTSNQHFSIKNISFQLNIVRLTNIYFFWLIASFIFMVTTGVGVLLSHATSPYSPIFNLFNVTYLFPVFYFLARESKEISKKYFVSIVMLFILYRILQGWSGVILMIFIFEIYFYFKNKQISNIKKLLIVVFIPLTFIFIGAKAYQHIHPIKNEIRGLGYTEITYVESLIKFVNRLTFFPISVGAYSKTDEISKFYKEENIELKEFKGTYRPILPRFLMDNKEFRSLNNNILQPFFYDITPYTSSDMGLIVYLYTLTYIDFFDALLVLITIIVFLLIVKIMYDILSQYPGQLNFLYFLIILKVLTTTAPEIVFGYGFIGLLYFIPVLYLFGILKIKKKVLA